MGVVEDRPSHRRLPSVSKEKLVSTTLIGRFKTRRDAEMAVEHMVQEHGLERTDIFISAAGVDNTAGEMKAGSDDEADVPNLEDEGGPALNGDIEVSVDIEDETIVEQVRATFREFSATDVVEQ
jgi:hypothetical protein